MASTAQSAAGSSSTARSLLRAELASSTRRINHAHAAYRSNKVLTCTICNLVVRSEPLWEGHLRSVNHRKNVQGSRSEQGRERLEIGRKRKVEEVESDGGDETQPQGGDDVRIAPNKRKAQEHVNDDYDSRKKTKSDRMVPRSLSFKEPLVQSTVAPDPARLEPGESDLRQEEPSQLEGVETSAEDHDNLLNDRKRTGASPDPDTLPPTADSAVVNKQNAIDESEWAAFEREIQPLATAPSAPLSNPLQVSATTIISAPISAAELKQQAVAAEKESNKTLARHREAEAQEEREEEARRLQDEFDLQDEMEARLTRLKEMREQLRKRNEEDIRHKNDSLQITGGGVGETEAVQKPTKNEADQDDDDDDDEEELDEWGFS